MQQEGQDDANIQLKQLLEQTLKPRGNDPVTAQSDLWAHARITPTLRNAALTLQASDVYKKVKPPGDTTLYKSDAWTLESIAAAGVRPAVQQAPQFIAEQLAAAFALPPGNHVLPEALKGPRVQPPS
ncbi:hypothetical protein OEZ86_005742 [Tetradesmus obliquus]|nr:hypothetical protein OEZ86_005742 [Tetradesmus obliquus]